jgi:hypothetical protein
MIVTAVVNSVVKTASAHVQVHYECRPITYYPVHVDAFPANSLLTGPFVDWADFSPPMLFDEYYGEEGGIPLGKYRPTSGVDSRGYQLVRGYIVLRCRNWRTQRLDGSEYWAGTEKPEYAGHHSLLFLPPWLVP